MVGEVMCGADLRVALCPVCHADQFRTWRWEGLEVCRVCGHVRKSTNMSGERIERLQESYFNADFAFRDDVFTRFYERLNAGRRLRELRRFLPGGHVLEVGVGHGQLLLTLKNFGYNVAGLDLSHEVCTAVEARCGFPIHCGTLEDYANTSVEAKYDAIIMCHLLEHCEAPEQTLRAANRVLRPGGIIYLAVPNLSAWNGYLPGWGGYEPYHMHYFRPRTLKELLASVGFTVVDQKTVEPLTGWMNTIVRSLRYRQPDIGVMVRPSGNDARKSSLRTSYNIVRLVGGVLLSPLRWVQSALGYGEELVAIARAD